MRKINELRRNAYIKSGFTFGEADILKVIPLNAPYSKIMRQDRIRIVRQAFREKWSRQKTIQAIRHQYIVRGWLREHERVSKANIFKMVRDYEQIWRNTASDVELQKWVSPSAKKSHHGSTIDHDKIRKQKQAYNARPEVQERRAKYRREHRPQIREAERKRRQFLRSQGIA